MITYSVGHILSILLSTQIFQNLGMNNLTWTVGMKKHIAVVKL